MAVGCSRYLDTNRTYQRPLTFGVRIYACAFYLGTSRLCGRAQLVVVPGGGVPGLHDEADAFAGGVRDVVVHRIGGHPGDAAGHAAADLQHARRVLDQPGQARHLDTAQVEVLLAGLHQAGQPGIAGEVARLLRGAVGPERDPPAEHDVEHRHQVWRPVPVDGRELELARAGQEGGYLAGRHGDPVALLHRAVPASKPIVSAARAIVSSQAKPAGGGPPGGPSAGSAPNTPASARCTESSVHMPSAEPWPAASTVARIRGGSITAATPPCTTNTSPLIPAAAGPARYTTSGATCCAASGSTTPSGGAPIRSAVIAVLARGQMALARTPYRAQLRAVVTVSAAMPALAAA